MTPTLTTDAKLSETESRALALWDQGGYRWDRPLTCTEIGESLYSDGHRTRQAYARPGGKLAAKLARAGYLRRVYQRDRADGYVRLR